MPDWHPATVTESAPAADGLTDLVLDVRGTPLAGTHERPGQYVHLRLPGVGQGLFAIASPPGPQGTHWEFLLKVGSPLPDALIGLPKGARVEVSRPEGRGFPMERARGQDVLLFATGSGISAIRSVITSIQRERGDYGEVTLYFGARTPGAFAYGDELQEWEAGGVRVVRTVSQPGASGWQGLTGYVQAHLGEGPLRPSAVAFLCGQKEMVQGVMKTLQALGMPTSDIHLNY
ncbi:Heterodisulfide reductase, cytochrome reductase subunit [Myxococcus hansupus]|uniref:Heterodisulfide reductase, cytochrome reductase subunit n=1 Tax=Pseudomyxococcus hansupus TaxID=1297742 RepID=A0A0H4XM27_9BACT|nr:Heterodisulfide reductase cytochrome reductase subunit [Myxococcus hansupus]AKQ69337.1 Heterodisulfide reductase, cytochrome reductase subunit [Myxococcus hansupus]